MQFEKEPEELAATYESRNERLQQVIDALAEHEEAEYDVHGFKSELAEENDFDKQRIYYVLENWNDLVKWRRHANRNPLDPHISEKAYDDPEMQSMATGKEVEYWECPSCNKEFDTSKKLAGHMGGSGCVKPDDWSLESAKRTTNTGKMPVADGAGGISIEVELQLDEIFRCMKLLPSDLGMRFFSQTLESSADIPASQLSQIFEANE